MLAERQRAESLVLPVATPLSRPILTSTTAVHLAANPHQGFWSAGTTAHRWQPASNPQGTKGMPVCLYESGRGSRSTGKMRDYESGLNLDYFGARYFSGAQGRFTSPDSSETPQPVPYADLADPQTLNLYSYVRNNPLNRTDPSGHCPSCLFMELVASPIGQSLSGKVTPYIDRILVGGAVITSAVLGGLASNLPGDSLGTPDSFGGGNPDVFQMSSGDSGSQARQGNGQQGQGQSNASTGPKIAEQKQAGHVPGTPQNENRKAQGKPTSEFFGAKSGEKLTQSGWQKGTPVPGKPEAKVWKPGISTGTGPNGGMQKEVKIHQDKKGRIHGHPSGPEYNE